MREASQRELPRWLWIVAGVAAVFIFLVGLIAFFAAGGLLFTWLNGVTRGTLPGQNQPNWGVPVGRMLYASDWEGDFEIYLEKASSGGRPARITHDAGADINPAFSPSGDQIVFQSDRDGHDNLYIMDVDGANLIQITADENDNWQPDWSPNGDQIVFSALGEDGKRHLYLIDIDGSDLTQLTFNGHDTNPAWSPDGSRIVFVRPSDTSVELYVIDADGLNETLLVSEPGTESDPRWSPDGSHIIFVLTGSAGISSLYTVDIESGNLTLFQAGMAASFTKCPVWSPDGRYLASVWGNPNSPYQGIQFFDVSNNAMPLGGAGSGGTVQGCDWGN